METNKYVIYVERPCNLPIDCDYVIPVSGEDALNKAISRAKHQRGYDRVTVTEVATGKIIYEKISKK